MDYEYELGKKIKHLRTKLNYSQDQLAEMLEMTRANVSGYELGRIAPPTDTLIKMADFFKVSLDYMVGRSENPHERYKLDSNISPEEAAKEALIKEGLARSETLLRNGKDVDEQKLNEALKYMQYLFETEEGKKRS